MESLMTPKNIVRLVGLLLCILPAFFPAAAMARDARQAIREGNKHFERQEYVDAERAYRRALEAGENHPKALFNLGNALYRQGRYGEAAAVFDGLAERMPDERALAGAYHNLGNALLKEQRFAEGVESYKQALRIHPQDDDTRYNLAYAMQFLQDPPPDGGSGDAEPEAGGDEQDEEPAPGGQEEMNREGDREQLSKQDAERILEALNQMEQGIQEKIQREEGEIPPLRSEKEW